MRYYFLSVNLFLFFSISVYAQSKPNSLRQTLVDLISKYKVTVGISLLELETGDTLSINHQTKFAMQSTYKFPLALAVLNKVEKGDISLQQKLFFSKENLDNYSWSPLKKQNPKSSFYMSVDSVLMYMTAYSDNLACDKLFELIGGTKVAHKFIHQQGFPEIQIQDTELEIAKTPNHMYLNSTTPTEMTRLLKAFYTHKIVNETHTQYLLKYMIHDSTSHNRILGKLPKEVTVAHKTGTGINICNDIGILYLPNGKHLAVAIFTMYSKETYETVEALIATLSQEIFDHYK